MKSIRDSSGNVVAIVFGLDEVDRICEGTYMFTPEDWGIQVGFARHSRGYRVSAHVHPRRREGVGIGSELLIVLRGRIRIDIYSCNGEYIDNVELGEGEGIVLRCGHAVEFLEDSVVLEVKEGPYPGKERDKVWL